jgi:hypothetical protein
VRFYTVPVKLSFKHKDTKVVAEGSLRKMCKLSCTTPYYHSLRKIGHYSEVAMVKSTVKKKEAMATMKAFSNLTRILFINERE